MKASKTMNLELAHKINKALLPISKKIHHINQGGCGAYAVLLADELIKYGFDAKIIELSPAEPDLLNILNGYSPDYYKKEYPNVLHALNTCRVNHTSPNNLDLGGHICVQVGDFYFDSTAVVTATNNTIELPLTSGGTEKFILIGELPEKDIHYAAIDNRGVSTWNSTYNADNNSCLKDEIAKALSFLKLFKC